MFYILSLQYSCSKLYILSLSDHERYFCGCFTPDFYTCMIWWPQMGIHIQNNIKREFWIPNCKLQLNLGRYYLFSMIYIAMSKIPEAITWSSSPFISSHLGLLLCCADGTVRADTMSWTGEETEAKNKLLTNFFLICWAVFILVWLPSLTCYTANSWADLWVRINPGDRESGAKVLLIRQCPEGAVSLAGPLQWLIAVVVVFSTPLYKEKEKPNSF